MTDLNSVYILYYSYDYEGSSPPEAVWSELPSASELVDFFAERNYKFDIETMERFIKDGYLAPWEGPGDRMYLKKYEVR